MKPKDKVLSAVHPNAGIAAQYRARIERLIDDMQRSYVYFLKAQYRATPPELAEDALPSRELQRRLSSLGAQWQARFDSAAPKLAKWFLKAIERRSRTQLMRILKDSGIAVNFTMTRSMRDVLNATLSENVSLIKSIASQYHTQVDGLVMRSVAAGRDLGYLTDELQARYGITRRRAKLIAKDQNDKATASMTRVRQLDAGITEAIWLHSHGGNEPRPTHLANSGQRYDVARGWFDPDPKVRRLIHPGELINCRCVSKPIVKGFS